MPGDLDELENKIGYYFRDKKILKEAMTHGSVRSMNRDLPHHERLEFLGDAILCAVISEYFFKQKVLAQPGELTDQRKALITDAKQNAIAEELGIRNYVEFGRGANLSAYRRWGEFIEAIIGAVYVDAGMGDGQGLQQARNVIFKLWKLEEPGAPCCVM